MWIFLADPACFLSVVRKPGDGDLTVRARSATDLLSFATICRLGEIVETPSNDYPFRAVVDPFEFAEAMAVAALRVTYPNFKAEVLRRSGRRREIVYHGVWALLREEITDDDHSGPIDMESRTAPRARPIRGRRRRCMRCTSHVLT